MSTTLHLEVLPVYLWFPVSKSSSLYQSVALQETPSVGVEDCSDYLRSGNVKLDDQSLELPDQE